MIKVIRQSLVTVILILNYYDDFNGFYTDVPKLKLSLETLGKQEGTKLIDSPTSIQACRIEGILPQDLLYK